ncbi:DUF4167 domain-containing protein [Brucella abortus]|uniref:DUF4167 domain-containing protein n=1 Tax=Brucella abortus TaxID=235 RepID=UPI0002CECEF2|nr:DUF4167 domain-containing protein [Brucella abortus]ENR66596.1 hypothetical protein C032_01722 [Brucella abortus 63/294]ENS12832.1 hypothetical protein C980_00437 [Brucella abortus 88/217]ERU06450.1 hypothetical protein P039_01406 [Brucella abortus 07-0994-2411]
MRPAQQNRRMRGRGNNNNNNNRKGPNPLSRNYESNGPDVKIRGNAQHIAEKYSALARDAQASGDRVMAENYLQHAEHYNRIIMAAMAQQNIPYQREENFDSDGGDDEEAGFIPAEAAPQPVIEGTPAEVVYGEENGEATKPGEGRQPREREGRDRRPQRERFGSEDRADDKQEEKAEQPQPAIEAPAAAARVEEAAPAVVEAAPVEASAEEAGAPRRATRRPGRPRRTAAKDSGDDTPVAEAADSDA